MKKDEVLDRIIKSAEPVFAVDHSHRIVLWNSACEDLFGRPAKSVVGKFCWDVIEGRDLHGNVYCYSNCPVSHQARHAPADSIRDFVVSSGNIASEDRRVAVSTVVVHENEMLSAIVHILRQNGAVSKLEREITSVAHSDAPAAPPVDPQTVNLTTREKEILRCMAEGLTTPEIAEKLFISRVTVRNHIQKILQKLGVHTKLAAVAFAYHHGLV